MLINEMSNYTMKKHYRWCKPFISQVTVAARTVAESSPTPMPFNTAWVANAPVMLLLKAYQSNQAN